MRAINSFVFFTSLGVLLVAFWNRNDVPTGVELLPALAQDPGQRKVTEKPFSLAYKGVSYEVEPRYAYELSGMLVSYRLHDGKSTMHRLSNDHLNVADFCVVWGESAKTPLLNKISFWNGIFTCNVSTSDSEAWAGFNMNQLSNNHLISDDELTRRAIGKVKVGDQIRVRGWLAHYGATGQPKRGTSITRTDQGNGACETIYVTDFELLRSAFSPWRAAMYTALGTLLLSILIHFSLPHRIDH
jgi:hypothetical protein